MAFIVHGPGVRDPISLERLFTEAASSAPAGLKVEKVIDKQRETDPNGTTHTIAYAWSVPEASQKVMLTLTTAPAGDAAIQAMGSVALVNE